jgi:hypothetical protein
MFLDHDVTPVGVLRLHALKALGVVSFHAS